MRRLLLYITLGWLVIVSFMVGARPAVVMACSGGGSYSTMEELLQATFIVKASVIQADDQHKNGILRVESYLTGGSGPLHLMLSQVKPEHQLARLEQRQIDPDCFPTHFNLHPGQVLYGAITRDPNTGTYSGRLYEFPTPNALVYLSRYVEQATPNPTVTPQPEATADYPPAYVSPYETIELTEVEFVALIAEVSGQSPTEPDMTTPFPFTAPLLLTDASDQQYILPVDGGIVVEVNSEYMQQFAVDRGWYNQGDQAALLGSPFCIPEGCIWTSPNGLDQAGKWYEQSTLSLTFYTGVTAQTMLYSSTSDAAALWNDSQLMIYTLGYPRLGQKANNAELVNSFALDGITDNSVLPEQAAWSLDGRMLAFTDARGLWLWDALTPLSQPSLLVGMGSDEVIRARYFSPGGRYLAVTQGEQRYTLDLVSGVQFKDGLVSPDDRRLLAFDTTAEVKTVELCSFTPPDCQAFAPLLSVSVSQIEWLSNYDYGIIWLQANNLTSYIGVTGDPLRYGLPLIESESDMPLAAEAFAYDPRTQSLAVLQPDNRIRINGHDYDLTAQLSTDITEIRWLPSLMTGIK
jgi:hypothetical protein